MHRGQSGRSPDSPKTISVQLISYQTPWKSNHSLPQERNYNETLPMLLVPEHLMTENIAQLTTCMRITAALTISSHVTTNEVIPKNQVPFGWVIIIESSSADYNFHGRVAIQCKAIEPQEKSQNHLSQASG